MNNQARLTFWGCRGSIPTPGPQTVVFGGNTSCVSIEYGSELLIFDAGTGIRELGQHLLSGPRRDIRQGRIFLSHTHWDHIQGLPFFRPAFYPGLPFTIYGERKGERSLTDVLAAQMQTPFFPVSMVAGFQGQVELQEVVPEQSVPIGSDITVTPFRLHHPGGAVGYRIRIGEVDIAYVTDHEHPVGRVAPDILAAVYGVDLLVHDAQYSRDELRQGKTGWGHSAWEDVIDLARAAQVQQLFLFHHDPTRTDEELRVRESLAQDLFSPVRVAREGLQVDLSSLLSAGRAVTSRPEEPAAGHDGDAVWASTAA